MAIELGLNEEQSMLKTMARDFLATETPKTFVREMMDDEVGHSPELWKKMAELGWQGLVFPEEYGGASMNFRDLTILCEEMGRAVMPGPFYSTVILVGLPILDFGSDEQKAEFLPKIANGEIVCTLAALEESGDLWADDLHFRALPRGDGYALSGTKMFVTDAKAADYMLVAARTRRTQNPEDGITLFMVNAKEWGIYMDNMTVMDLTRKQYAVRFTDVPVSASNIIGELHGGWPILQQIAFKASAVLSAEMVGVGEMAMEMTVAYLKDRMQFGVVIGTFQALKHKAADMYAAMEYSRSLMEWAAECVKENDRDAPMAVSMAKSYCGDSVKFVTDAGVQLHGGIGFTWDHDMHLYFKRGRYNDTAFGDGNYHKEVIARQLEANLM
ncbi:MAG: acyl-CoA/acyl-ACP dehydrogenase [Dehalococcoidales bacterium]|nr:MAG: acyl-CoA/acyl-ACP dehydrogenase [Dehalococcoidales bacterium]